MLVVGVLAWALTGCVGNVGLSFLDPQGPVARAERWHFFWVLGIMAVFVAAPIFMVLPFLLWRYRYHNKKARYTPKWKAFGLIEVITWAGPIAIVCVLGVLLWNGSHQLDPYKVIKSDKAPLQMQIVGYDWKWLIIYPQQGIATVGTMPIPVNRPVSIHLTSATVMQSFFIPSLGSQIYAMGGMVTQLNLEAGQLGRFLGENTMYNGNGFHGQKFTAVAMSPRGFDDWVKHVQQTGVPLDTRILKAISRTTSRRQMIDQLPGTDSRDGKLYLTGVSKKLFPRIVKATRRGTGVPTVSPAGLSAEKTAPAPRKSADVATRETP